MYLFMYVCISRSTKSKMGGTMSVFQKRVDLHRSLLSLGIEERNYTPLNFHEIRFDLSQLQEIKEKASANIVKFLPNNLYMVGQQQGNSENSGNLCKRCIETTIETARYVYIF